jgi:hypothetical protein
MIRRTIKIEQIIIRNSEEYLIVGDTVRIQGLNGTVVRLQDGLATIDLDGSIDVHHITFPK